MTQTADDPVTIEEEYRRIERGGRLHVVHWLVVGLSLLLTFVAWYTVERQIQQKAEIRFETEAARVVELVTDRMAQYEDALTSGTAAIHALDGDIDRLSWRKYADVVNLQERLPGINGIGVIFQVPPENLSTFIDQERLSAPDFRIHPSHDGDEFWPITYIEPEVTNRAAIGLDMAHETNRFTAAKAARDTGAPQITAPIILVQDAKKTPGFLLFAPFYRCISPTNEAQRQEEFIGMVYAPFIFSRLMEGVLSSERRPVGISITDANAAQDDVLYDELHSEHPNHDPEPMFSREIDVDMYGRIWRYRISTNLEFRELISSNESTVILIGGIIIDSLLLALFLFLAHSNRAAINFAQRATASLEEKTRHLESANEELGEFTYRTSHDLRSPLLSSVGLLDVAARAIDKEEIDKARISVGHAKLSLKRLADLIEDLLSISKAEHAHEELTNIDLELMVEEILANLQKMEGFDKITIDVDSQLENDLISQPVKLERVLENLISNAVKYQDPDETHRTISISARQEGTNAHIHIEDNGLGIPAEYHDKLFTMFNRFHPRIAYGSGLGLYIVRKSLNALGGSIRYSNVSKGSLFIITLPLNPNIEAS